MRRRSILTQRICLELALQFPPVPSRVGAMRSKFAKAELLETGSYVALPKRRTLVSLVYLDTANLIWGPCSDPRIGLKLEKSKLRTMRIWRETFRKRKVLDSYKAMNYSIVSFSTYLMEKAFNSIPLRQHRNRELCFFNCNSGMGRD